MNGLERDVAERRVAVVTGGASGIGLATAHLLADHGWSVVIADVDEGQLRAAVDGFAAGAEVVQAVVDVRFSDQLAALADLAYDRFGHVNVLFNNAGVAVMGPIAKTTHDDWTWLNDVNLQGPINGVEAFLPRMISSGCDGHILFTASFAGVTPVRGLGAYSVAKYGVVALAEVLHRELSDTPLGVSVLCPMRVDTNIVRSERNRPGGSGTTRADFNRADFDDAAFEGVVLPAEAVARMVVDTIGTDRLYIFTHPEIRELVARRFKAIDEAFANPVHAPIETG